MSEIKVKVLATLAFTILLSSIAVLAPKIPDLRTTYDIQQFFPAHYEGWDVLAEMRKTFRLETNPSLLVMVSSNEPWTQFQKLKNLSLVAGKIKNVPGISRILTLPEREVVLQDKESIRIGKLLDLIPQDQWQELFAKDALIRSLLITKDLKTAVIGVELSTWEVSEYAPVIEAIQKLLKEPNTITLIGNETSLGGVAVIQNSFREILKAEISRFVGISILISILLIFLLFQGSVAWISTLITLLVANIIGIGFMAKMGWSFTVLSTTIPILIAIIVVSQTVYSFFRLDEEFRNNEGTEKSHWLNIWDLNKTILVPNFLGHFTTALGFCTLIYSDVPLISNYGGVLSVVILIAWIATTLSLFCFMGLFTSPRPRKWTQLNIDFSGLLTKYSKKVVVFTLLLSFVLAGSGFFLHWTAKLFDDLPKNHPSRASTELIDQQLGGLIPIDLELISESTESWKDPRLIERIENTLAKIRALPEVGSALGLPDFLKLLSENGETPKSGNIISEILFLYSLNPASPLQHFLSTDGLKTRLAVRLKDVPADQSIRAHQQIQEFVRAEFKELKVRDSGLGTYIHRFNNLVSAELIFGFWTAMAAIGFSLIFIFRSLRWALVACLPNFFPPLVLFGVMSLFQTPIKPALALVFAIAIGFAFNNTIYILMRFKSLAATQKVAPNVDEVIKLEINGCLFSTLVVIAGFLVFLWAQFSVNQLFGTFMIVSTLAGVLADLIFFPCLLKVFPQLLFPATKK